MTQDRTPAQSAAHGEVMRVFAGLLMTLFVAMLAQTIVGTALPVIIADLDGTQMQYTWIVTAAMLASTVATPIFGKLADLLDKKVLLMVSIGIFALGSLLSGMVTSAGMLIVARTIQGLGMGAQMSMVQIAMAAIIPPRERGRYNGYLGAVMAVATVSGPLLGGLIVDVPWLGWRWTFWSAVPFTLLAVVVLAKFLRIPSAPSREVRIDYWGTALITLSVTSLLLWLSFAGNMFPWASWQTVAMVGLGVGAAVAFVLVELRVPEPIVPMWLLTRRTSSLAIVASFVVGMVMMSMPVFLGQYFQLGRAYGPTESGLLMVPMMIGVFISSTIAGRLVSAQGTWKRYVVGGMLVMAVGAALMGFVDHSTPMWFIAIAIAIVGVGQGASMQNLVLAVQNTVGLANMGVATSAVTFFRTLGGAAGLQILNVVFAGRVDGLISSRAAESGAGAEMAHLSTSSVDFGALPPAVETLVRNSYGDAMGLVFAIQAGIVVLAALAVVFMKGSTLRDTVDLVAQAEVKAVLDATGSAHAAGVAVSDAVSEGPAPDRSPATGQVPAANPGPTTDRALDPYPEARADRELQCTPDDGRARP